MENFKLKDIYSPDFVRTFAELVQRRYSPFPTETFIAAVLDDSWNAKELKERMRHITLCLRKYLPQHYSEALDVLMEIAPECNGFPYMFFPDFVEQFGLRDEDSSIAALELFTQYSSAEFAIRPFILKNPVKIMSQMRIWSEHPNHHIRRLASEGCRPRLPWAIALKDFQRDPAPVLPILEHLKTDESEYVRRSVANNLNDISKDHPALVLEIAERWKGQHSDTDRILKHALRTLLKRGNMRALALFGFQTANNVDISISDLKFLKNSVNIGDSVNFSFDIQVNKESALRLEYGVYYVKASGEAVRKVFFLHEKEYATNSTNTITRKLSFQQRTTRKHYAGKHRLTIIVNGKELAETAIEVR